MFGGAIADRALLGSFAVAVSPNPNVKRETCATAISADDGAIRQCVTNPASMKWLALQQHVDRFGRCTVDLIGPAQNRSDFVDIQGVAQDQRSGLQLAEIDHVI